MGKAFDRIKDGLDDAIALVSGHLWSVEVLPWDSETPVRVLQAESYSHAEKLSRGLNVNLDHDKYRTVIVPPTAS